MLHRFIRNAVLFVSALLTGCTIISDRLGVSYQNQPDLGGKSNFSTSKPVPRATSEPKWDKPTFTGIAISGGGSRAANFGMAVLAELDELGLLRNVDAISSVSGGSIPTAYFALNSSNPNWKTQGREVVKGDMLDAFMKKLFNPVNFTETTFTDKDRSDLLASVFQEKIFAGQHPTFADLGARGPMRPSIYLNATDTTNGGERFVFTDDRFFTKLGSSLSDYPLAWAMASSGAFPGIFNSVTLRHFSADPVMRKEEESAILSRRYVHLIDGGASDNFGINTLIELARDHHVAQLNKGEKPQGCFMFLVDSHVPSTAMTDSSRSDRRNPFSALIDLNFLDAIDAMFTNRRGETLASLGIQKDNSLGQFNIDMGNGMKEYGVAPYKRTGTFNISYYELDGKALTTRYNSGNENDSAESGIVQKAFQCTAWHIAIEDVQSIIPHKIDTSGQSVALNPRNLEDKKQFAYRAKLSRVLKQLKTNYRLAGPDNCTADFLQQSLYDAAHIVIREDKPSVENACAWFVERGLVTAEECHISSTLIFREIFNIEPVVMPRNLEIAEQNTNRFVRCPSSNTPPSTKPLFPITNSPLR